jgi:predicted house-cleaning noncanonical NTP pyrophosphatase (MazG superfamily)
MAYVPRTPFDGKLTISVEDVKDLLHDLPPQARRKLKREKPGFGSVLDELRTGLPKHGKTLGLSPDLLQKIEEETANIAKLEAARSDLAKLLEVVEESIALQEDEREQDITAVAEAAKKAAQRKDPSVAAPFEKTMKYHSQVADKAVATRRKNAEGGVGGPEETTTAAAGN